MLVEMQDECRAVPQAKTIHVAEHHLHTTTVGSHLQAARRRVPAEVLEAARRSRAAAARTQTAAALQGWADPVRCRQCRLLPSRAPRAPAHSPRLQGVVLRERHLQASSRTWQSLIPKQDGCQMCCCGERP